MSDQGPDALRRLEERLSQASEAAERLVADASRRATRDERSAGKDHPPPSGWQTADSEKSASGPGELESLLAALGSLRDLVPPEVLARVTAALRELLLALRALIDFYLDRLERPRPTADEVRDIPID
jgi:hypothetical protein